MLSTHSQSLRLYECRTRLLVAFFIEIHTKCYILKLTGKNTKYVDTFAHPLLVHFHKL